MLIKEELQNIKLPLSDDDYVMPKKQGNHPILPCHDSGGVYGRLPYSMDIRGRDRGTHPL